ncbi:MAG: HD domain-containing protein [Sphingobacteriales bacterium]|nr:MAG: HD domain-containing protein [Sphingobacteriales bacterium]
MTKIKIFNDPVYGFVRLPKDIIFDLVEHPYFQRLRRIKQLGMTHYVYPGALHTRFNHALGAHHLVSLALENLKSKGIKISDEDCEGVSMAVLLHDIGHGPFSHALENVLVKDIHHEEISQAFMQFFNDTYKGRLENALAIFKGEHPKKFLHQLVSSQLDVDRLDYLKRDSFYTGVSEGVIGSDRIIKMLHVVDNELVVEAKGIYSIEKFLLARRLMYWQVYLHKTVLSAEQMLIKILQRAQELASKGEELFATPAFRFFLYNQISKDDFKSNSKVLDTFAQLDDYDVLASIKTWMQHSDFVLSTLCRKMIDRHLYKCVFQNTPFTLEQVKNLQQQAVDTYMIAPENASYFVFTDMVQNSTYSAESIAINIMLDENKVTDIAEVSDQYDLTTLTRKVTKYFLCYPKELNAADII